VTLPNQVDRPSFSKTLQDRSLADIRAALAGAGLWFDYGAVTLNLRSNSVSLAAQVHAVYGSFEFVNEREWADLHVQLVHPLGLRRWVAPQVVFRCDGVQPFEPFPADSPLPLLEWGGNWLIGQRLNDLLLLHAGAVERDGLTLLMPALPGSGKSTLTAALSLSGWRLLSDEFGAFDPVKSSFVALLKPIALKNASIGVIRDFAPSARLGPEFPKTRKGAVAHLGADSLAVARRGEPARPGAVVLPKWVAGSPTKLEALSSDRLFSALAFNAFNYSTLGAVGFDAVIDLVRRCPAWTLVYSDLSDALVAIDGIWREVVDRNVAVASSLGAAI
jgi:HprK-related kinase A